MADSLVSDRAFPVGARVSYRVGVRAGTVRGPAEDAVGELLQPIEWDNDPGREHAWPVRLLRPERTEPEPLPLLGGCN